jgi:two-component system response regulator AtoC
MLKILVAEDDPNMVSVLSEVLRDDRRQVIATNNADRALELIQQDPPDLVLADIEMPEGNPSGLTLLRKAKEHNRLLPVVMITGNATKERAVEALRLGAHDFIEKPFRIDELIKRVETALFQQKAVHALQENAELKNQLREKFRFDNIVGTSAQMEAVYRMIERVANTDSTVLILGESGTGKELVAKALHYNSRRAAMPFVAVNCAALPEHLLESELFGHRKGAFTGAAFDKVGLFQHADGGTIFLDEVGSMALSLQSKLLRFLQDKEMRRVGDTQTISVDVRVIAATNEPLQDKLKEKTFREDLYYRISVIPIQLPSLRERRNDIPLLVSHFTNEISRRLGIPSPSVPDDVLEILRAYHWPGNVRELQNALERACALCDGGVIALKDLPERVLEGASEAATPTMLGDSSPMLDVTLAERASSALQWAKGYPPMPLKDFLHQQEVVYIERTIEALDGDKEKASQILGISMATLYRKLTPPEANAISGDE